MLCHAVPFCGVLREAVPGGARRCQAVPGGALGLIDDGLALTDQIYFMGSD